MENKNDLNDAILAATNKAVEGEGLSSMVELSFACHDLPNLDTFTKTDAMCVLY